MKNLFVIGLIAAGAVCFGSTAQASESFTLKNNHTGTTYQCGVGGGGGGTDPACVQEVGDYCYKSTSRTRHQCFELASRECRGTGQGFGSCVKSTTDYCYKSTSYTREQCFDRALQSCRGSAAAIQDLMSGTVQFERLRQMGLSTDEIKKLSAE